MKFSLITSKLTRLSSPKKKSFSSYFDKYLRGIVYSCISRVFLLPFRKNKKRRLVLVSHRFAGNAKSFAEWLTQNHPDIEVVFATDDPEYYRSLQNDQTNQLRMLSLQKFMDWVYISSASVILTTHGPTFFIYWRNAKNKPTFFELWHGVGFKGRDPLHAKSLEFYKSIFVSSQHFKSLHRSWGFSDDKLAVTGYSRTDELVKSRKISSKERVILLEKFGLSNIKNKLVVLALTWKHSGSSESLILNEDANYSLKLIEDFANKNDITVVLRMHLNDNLNLEIKKSSNLKVVPFSTYPDTEALLKVTDILVTDWSSIYTDFLALQRPVIFVDNRPTFDGHSLTDTDRAGPVITSTIELLKMIDTYIKEPLRYPEEYRSSLNKVTKKAWGNTLDARSSERYYNILKEYI